jgi:hypothetical protein
LRPVCRPTPVALIVVFSVLCLSMNVQFYQTVTRKHREMPQKVFPINGLCKIALHGATRSATMISLLQHPWRKP